MLTDQFELNLTNSMAYEARDVYFSGTMKGQK